MILRANPCRALSLALVSVWATLPAIADTTVADLITDGDASYERRAEGHQGDQARPEPIKQAIDAYSAALTADPDNLEARWKLLRALYFQGEFVLQDPEARLALYEQGREIADEGRRQIEGRHGLGEDSLELEPTAVAAAIGKDPLAAEIYFWSSTHWGLWGRHRGKIAAAKQGVATKIRKLAEIVILLDDRIENAGGHRVLGRLHAEAPKIPLVTGWIDRDMAVAELRRAHELAPDDQLTQLFLAEALIEFRPDQRQQGLEMLAAVAASEPSENWLVEDSRSIADAKALLAEQQD